MPPLSGLGGTAIVVNAGGTALANTTGTLTLSGNLSLSSNFTTTGAFTTSLTQQANVTLTLPATSDTLATLSDTTATLTSASHNTGRNFIHNPVFTIAQRGAGPFTTSVYTLDRWLLSLTNDTGSITQAALADADRTAIGDEAATVALQNVFAGSATANSFSKSVQPIETIRRLSGKTVTVSFWARATSSTPVLGVSALQVFGTGGSPSASVRTLFGRTAALSTTWTKFTLTAAIPSAAGKTFGSNVGTDSTGLEFVYSDTSNLFGFSPSLGQQSGTVQIWGVQLEIGSTATTLEKRDPQTELSLCQRFYETGTASMAVFVDNGLRGFSYTVPFVVQKRAAPTMAGTFTYGNAGTGTMLPSVTGCNFQAISTGVTGQASFSIPWTATADL